VPILQDFYIQIQDSENFIFFTHNHTHNEFEYTVDFFIPFYYSWWQLKICPTERLQNEASPLGSWQILLLGLGFSILGFLTYITLLLGKKNLKKEFQEKSKLEEELFQAQKMESLGTLAGGIVHDSNNILMGIQGYISLLTEDLLNLDESSEQVNSFKKESDFYISGMNDAIERARNLNRQILQFSRYKTQDKKVIDTKFALKTLIQVFSQTIDKRIEVETKFTANPIFLLIDPTIFQQIILNILINSRDAMPNGGILSISCNIIQKKFQLATQPLEWIQIQIKDTGIGIKKENISRVFDPFFTTKDKNSGTGLGLSIVYRAMKKIGGQININSEEHEGTTINLYFPYVHSLKLEKSRIISPKIINKFVIPGLNILIIDDEIPIITLFVKYLTNLQIEVDAISNPNNIMSHYSNYSNKYHLILLDVNLPKISGPEIYMKMKAINPDQKVIFITGYSEYEIDQTNKNILGVILKPFNFSEIKTALFKHFPEFHQKLSEI
jgi:two-component system cell cycle sensor histidine kinase/response regulator CckA